MKDVWAGPDITERPSGALNVRRYRIIEPDPVDDALATVEASDGSRFQLRFPTSLQPYVVNGWAWCIHSDGRAWPFAVD